MWDNHALLRNIANSLLVFSVIAVSYGAAYFVMHLPGAFPLHSVRLSVVPQRVSAEQVRQVLRTELQGNLVTVDIERLRRSLEKLPWVRSVNIRREFPSSLEVSLEEHQALARWNGDALVNRQGEVFVAESERAMPRFIGPEGTSAEMTKHYAEFSRQLAELDLNAAQLVLSPRHAWQMRLSNGMVMKLGHEDMQQRLARFVAVYPYGLKTEDSGQRTDGKVACIDLRYRNGFAVSRIANDKG